MTNEELLQIESSARQRHDEILYQERSVTVCEASDFNLFSILKPKLYIDGIQWCCLYGDDLQSGIAGFGDSPRGAILDWNTQWHRKLPAPKGN